MKTILSFIILSLSTFTIKAQTDTVQIVFAGFYDVNIGQNKEKYYSLLLDSTYYKSENLSFIRVLNIGNREQLAKSLISGRTYSVVIQRKLQHSAGCENDLMHIRSSRAQTDVGTLFGSNFLEEEKVIAMKSSCNYKAIEYYYILELK